MVIMSTLDKLKAATDLPDVANLLGYQAKSLSYILYVKPKSIRYKTFTIPKKSGGVRVIKAPSPDLKILQKRLAVILQDCIAEINNSKKIDSALSHGFRRKYSIMTNALVHRGKRFVLNLDIEDFFPSINFGRVRGFFISNKNFLLDPKVATLIAQISCDDNFLPQGSPCSPVISNLIGHILDIRLADLAKKEGCTYSRYVDDITFSTNKKIFPSKLAYVSSNSDHKWQLGDSLLGVIKRSGFKVNNAKTRMLYSDSRQEVTGLVVNKKINSRSEYRHMARAMLFMYLKTGNFFKIQSEVDANNVVVKKKVPASIDYLNGVLSFIASVYLFNFKKNSNEESAYRESVDVFLNSTFSSNFRNFLIHKYFIFRKSPIIICEGKTDNIYLKCAIRRLAIQYPSLARVSNNQDANLLVEFFNRTSFSNKFLGLTGGVGQFKNLIVHLSDLIETAGDGKLSQPIIFVIDNDAAASGFYKFITNKFKIHCDKNASFIEIIKGIYVVPTPLLANGAFSIIENLFEKNVIEKELNGKKFNPANVSVSNKEYGKTYFATHVVQAQEANINFSGFNVLLSRIENVITSFNK
jgi:RNA-directed DNA polymerase